MRSLEAVERLGEKQLVLPDIIQRTSLEEAPTSLEVIRRKVMVTVGRVERETTKFRDYFLKNVKYYDPGTWMAVVYHVNKRTATKMADLHDYKDLEPLLDKVKFDYEVASSDEYKQLKELCDRGRAFEYIAFSVRNDLEEAYLNLRFVVIV